LERCSFFESAEELLAKAELDGIFIGTRCNLHAEMASKAAARKLPIFIEKPLAITFEGLRRLVEAFHDYPAPTVVSHPLRVTPVAEKVRELIERDTIGRVDHVVAFNDVPYGRGYYCSWYRNFEETGGLWLQKATHDFDCINYLVARKPVWIFAAHQQRVYGGDKPNELRCSNCPEVTTCPESHFNLFYDVMKYDRAVPRWEDLCVFAERIRNQDCGNAIIEYEDGLQASYTQNFFARWKAARRGARLYGYKGTIEFDWYQDRIRIFGHRKATVSTIEFPESRHHFHGDRELCYDFLMAMKERRPSRSPVEAGILSAAMCLWARQSAEKRQPCEIRIP